MVTSTTEDGAEIRAIDVPTLVLHGDDDQVVPIGAAARDSIPLVDGARFEVHPGAPSGPHGT